MAKVQPSLALENAREKSSGRIRTPIRFSRTAGLSGCQRILLFFYFFYSYLTSMCNHMVMTDLPKRSKRLANTTAHIERIQASIKNTTAMLGKTETEVIYLAK